MSIEEYWPKLEEIDKCIKPEAESVPESVLLAVHQPLPLLKKATNGQVALDTTETELLKEFLSSQLPTGTLLMPITGPSGSGKSHMIRWLHAQLSRAEESQRMHIIRIPKSSSLRSVVGLILEPLKGDEYEKLRRAFQSAVDAVSPEDAVIQFRAGLEMALNAYAEELKAELSSASREERDLLQVKIGHAKRLPTFFMDGVLCQYFDTHVLRRIVSRSVVGRQIESSKDDDNEAKLEFLEEDLLLPSDVPINHAARPVYQYYLGSLHTQQQRQSAVDVLKKVTDKAVANAFKLSQNLSGMTLQDVILHIRRQLLAEGKELVILIEDFYALTGIQETLLSICIQEAVRDGEQTLCTMRTMVAVTDGYLAGRDTILTRAQYEWIINSHLSSEQDTLNRVVDLVGTYTNAARHGDRRLRQMFEESVAVTGSSGDLTAWIKPFSADGLDDITQTTLDAFGTTKRGFHLFPLNRFAIKELARRHLISGGRMIFNPRIIINRIIRDVLLFRDLYEQNRFPPPGFNTPSVPADVALGLSRLHLQPGEKDRYESFICFWGGNPLHIDQLASLPPQVFHAFNLTPLAKWDGSKPEEPTELPIEEKETPPNPNDQLIKDWQELLEKWVSGTQLGQVEANKIRQVLLRGVNSFVNWNAYHLRKPNLTANLFWLPNTATTHYAPSDKVIRVVETNSDPDGRIRKCFLSLIRYDLNGRSWNYPEAHEDSVCYATLLEEVSKKVVDFCRADADIQLVPIIQGLAASSLILGLSLPLKTTDVEKLADVLLSEVSEAPKKGMNEKWDSLRNDCYRLWKELQWEFQVRTVCFQGDGHTPYAFDSAGLSHILSGLELYGTIDVSQLAKGLQQNRDVRAILQQLNSLRLLPLVKPIFESLKEWCQTVVAGFGKDFNKETMLGNLKEVISMVKKEGNLWPINSKDDDRSLNERINFFRKLPIKENIDLVTKLDAEFDPTRLPDLIYLISRIDPSTIRETTVFLKAFGDFLEGLERRLSDQMPTFEGQSLADVKEDIDAAFKNLDNKLANFVEDTDDTGR